MALSVSATATAAASTALTVPNQSVISEAAKRMAWLSIGELYSSMADGSAKNRFVDDITFVTQMLENHVSGLDLTLARCFQEALFPTNNPPKTFEAKKTARNAAIDTFFRTFEYKAFFGKMKLDARLADKLKALWGAQDMSYSATRSALIEIEAIQFPSGDGNYPIVEIIAEYSIDMFKIVNYETLFRQLMICSEEQLLTQILVQLQDPDSKENALREFFAVSSPSALVVEDVADRVTKLIQCTLVNSIASAPARVVDHEAFLKGIAGTTRNPELQEDRFQIMDPQTGMTVNELLTAPKLEQLHVVDLPYVGRRGNPIAQLGIAPNAASKPVAMLSMLDV